MGISILRLNSGEEVIAEIDNVDDSNMLLINPMLIVDTRDGMKLRDMLLLSETNQLTINRNSIILNYPPLKSLCDYYCSAVIYSEKHTRATAVEQIIAATLDMEDAIREQEVNATQLNKLLSKMGSPTRH